MLTKIIDYIANNNFFNRPTIIRKWQCNIFGHEWFTYLPGKDNEPGWCAWCARKTGKYPKMRVREPENTESLRNNHD